MKISIPWATAPHPTNPSIFLVNNPHGVPDLEEASYRQDLEFVEGPNGETEARISASIPPAWFNPAVVRVYPQIYQYMKDRSLPGATGALPARLSTIGALATQFEAVIVNGTGEFNIAAEMFVHSDKQPSNVKGPGDTRLYEIMYWTHRPRNGVIGLGQVLLDNPEFEVRHKPGVRDYVAIMLKTPPAPGVATQIEWMSIVNLVNQLAADTGLIDPVPDCWVTAQELGIEGWAGDFDVLFKQLEFSVELKAPVEDSEMPRLVEQDLASLHTLCNCLSSMVASNEQVPMRNIDVLVPLMLADIRTTLNSIGARYEP